MTVVDQDVEASQRDRVCEVARTWVGTPFHDHGEIKGVGTDCAKLLKCVFVEAGVIEDFDIGYYSSQHFMHQSDERFLGWVSKFAREIPQEAARYGDVAIYHVGRCFAHGAIIMPPGWPRIVHAHYASRQVVADTGTKPRLGTRTKAVKFFTFW
jgi:hypothetical protein